MEEACNGAALFVVTDVVIWSVLVGRRVDCVSVDCGRSVDVLVVAVILWPVLPAAVVDCWLVRSAVVAAVIVSMSSDVSVDVGGGMVLIVRASVVTVEDISLGVIVVLDCKGLSVVVRACVAVAMMGKGVVVGKGVAAPQSAMPIHW